MGVFLGWRPDAAMHAALGAVLRRLQDASPVGARQLHWHPPAQWHMTLRYLGANVEPAQLPAIDAALSAFARTCDAATSTLVDVQYWPASNVLVAAAEGSPSLVALLDHLERLVQGCGFPPAPAQVPHVTLARVAGAEMAPDLLATPVRDVPVVIASIELMQTIAGGYATLASWRLAPGKTAA